MLLRLILLLTIVPLVELYLLLQLAIRTNPRFTFALVIVTGIVGAVLARWQGMRTVRRLQDELGRGRMPADAMLDGVLILVAGAVLITPGVLTDALGFALLVPPIRNLFKRWMAKRFRARFTVGPSPRHPNSPGTEEGRDRVIESRLVDRDDEE